MSNVLGAVKDPESQPSQKVPWREVSCHRPDLKTRLLLQIIVHVLQLWDIVLPRETNQQFLGGSLVGESLGFRDDIPVSSLLLQLFQVLVELCAGVLVVEFGQGSVDCPPGLDLLLGILHPRNVLAPAIISNIFFHL